MPRVVILLALLATAARAERLVIDLSGAHFQPYPIAIGRPAGDAEVGQMVLDVLAADFERSGLFKVLDPRSFLADEAREGMGASSIEFGRWTAVGAQGLVKASARASEAEVQVEFRLFETAQGAPLLSGTYRAPRDGLRQIAHRFGDDVIRKFTQEPGVFQTRIAYVREMESGKQIVVADSDGFGPQPVTGASINLLPAWAPDGRSLTFTSFRGGLGPHLYRVDLASREVKPLVLSGDFATGAVYSPDGHRFAFSAGVEDNTDIYLARADGSGMRRLTEARGIDISASWSPDGRRIAFVSERSGSPQIYTMAADGSDVRRLTFQGNFNQEPAWSPRGDLIAFSGRDEHRVFDLYTVNVQSGKVVRLTQNQGTNEKPSWAPNGRLLVFSSTRTGRKQIWSTMPDGSNQRQITNEPQGASDPAWGPLPRR